MALFNLFKAERSSRRVCIILALVVVAFLTVSIDTSMADITETVKLIPEDGAYGDLFGSSVSISGDYAIVGAPSDDEGIIKNSGCAYIFERTKGIWSEKAKLFADDGFSNDVFGSSVSISGKYAIVGSPFDTHTGSYYGSAYIFHRTEPFPGHVIWNQVEKLVASDGGYQDFFGTSVSISGDYAVVGAPYDDDNGSNSGSAYIFHRIETLPGTFIWSQVAKLVAPDGSADDFFGTSVSISGDDAVVGAPRYDDDRGADIGSMYIFKRSEDTWSTWGASVDNAGAAGDEFGWSVSIDGHFALAGAHFYDDEGLTNSGSARIFEEIVYNSGVWGSGAYQWLKPSDGAASDEFGFSVSISGDNAVIGTLKYINGTGTAYIFQKSTDEDDWLQFVKLIASDSSPWGFGSAVSISGRYAIIGARHDINTAGSAYLYDLLADPDPSPSGAIPGIPLLLLLDE